MGASSGEDAPRCWRISFANERLAYEWISRDKPCFAVATEPRRNRPIACGFVPSDAAKVPLGGCGLSAAGECPMLIPRSGDLPAKETLDGKLSADRGVRILL